MFEAAKRLSNRKTKKKQALRPNELKQIHDHLSSNQSSLENLRLLNICLIAVTGFMRFSEVASIKGYDIIYTETYMKIFIKKKQDRHIQRRSMGLHITITQHVPRGTSRRLSETGQY